MRHPAEVHLHALGAEGRTRTGTYLRLILEPTALHRFRHFGTEEVCGKRCGLYLSYAAMQARAYTCIAVEISAALSIKGIIRLLPAFSSRLTPRPLPPCSTIFSSNTTLRETQ